MSQQPTIDQAFASITKNTSNPSNTSSIQVDPKKNQQLRKKRNLEIIERNHLIRRFYYPVKPDNEYQTESNAYGILNHFDFDSPPYNKFSSIKNISANAFWFLICSNYFPYLSNELIDQKECIPEELKKLIDYINTNNISINKKNSNFGEKFNFLKEIKKIVQNFSKQKNNLNEKNNLFQTTNINSNSNENIISLNESKSNIDISNLSCTNSISSIKSLLENLIKYFEHENENKILSKITKDYLLTSNYNRDIRFTQDFDLDIKYHTKSFNRFREEILDKVEQNEEDENDDVVCYVCGDGEYEDDNLILYCSKCNMTVHQRCYGVTVIPEEDWICHLCRSFSQDVCKNMECILCPQLGGAMKPCTLRKSSHSYKIMQKCRKNSSLKDNNYKNNNLNFNNNKKLFNSFSNEIKDDKFLSNILNSNDTKKEKENNNLQDSNIFGPDLNQITNTENSIIPNNNNITNSINVNSINNNNIELSLNNNNNILTNSPNNNDNNHLQQNNISGSCRSSNINKETESIYSNNSSFNKNNIKEDSNNINPINTSNKNESPLIKKQTQKMKAQNEIYLSEKVAKENAWVHLSCALWLPEINFANFELKEKIKGVENITKKRLQENCDICLKTGYGPVIKCQKCLYHFHPECARRLKKFFLEINENENGDTTFLAYCNKDTPPKHLKKYELIKQRKKDEIKKFSDLIKKDISSLNKMHEDKQYNLLHPFCYYPNNNEIKKILNNKKNNLNESNNYLNNNDLVYNDSSKKSNINGSDKNIELTSSEKKCLVNAIREILIDESNLTLEINTEDYSIKKNNNIKFTFEDMTYPEKFSWCYLKETQDYLNGISNFETFKIYQSIIPTKNDFIKNILKEKVVTPEKPKKIKKVLKQKHKKKENEEHFCICGKPFQNNQKVDWVGCDNDESKCPGKGWFHISCIPELKNYNLETFDTHFKKYYCPKCRELYGLKNEVNDVNEIDVHLNESEKNNINISINNNGNNNILNSVEKEKEKENVIECVNIINNEQKKEKNNKDDTPMNIEDESKKENDKK